MLQLRAMLSFSPTPLLKSRIRKANTWNAIDRQKIAQIASRSIRNTTRSRLLISFKYLFSSEMKEWIKQIATMPTTSTHHNKTQSTTPTTNRDLIIKKFRAIPHLSTSSPHGRSQRMLPYRDVGYGGGRDNGYNDPRFGSKCENGAIKKNTTMYLDKTKSHHFRLYKLVQRRRTVLHDARSIDTY